MNKKNTKSIKDLKKIIKQHLLDSLVHSYRKISYNKPDIPKSIRTHALLISWGGSGYMKPASGTWGTLAGMPFAFILAYLTSPIMLIVFSAILFFVGWYATYKYEQATNKHDASEIVIDEVCGVFITLSVVPLELSYYILGFLSFRLFDIWKPYPIRNIDKLKTPFSVMYDDVLAGIFGAITILGIQWLNI